MCIINDKVKDVSNTNILVSPDNSYLNQLTIYSNNIENDSKNNAMILAVPNIETIKFVDMSNYKDIFKDCEDCFTEPISRSNGISKGMTKSFLEVIQSGSYFVSIAKSIEDLKRIDSDNLFVIDEECYDFINKEYSEMSNFGFLVCLLNNDTKKNDYTPLAYTHGIYNRELFIPTLHYHKHEVKEVNNADWDHSIYTVNSELSTMFRITEKWNNKFTDSGRLKTFNIHKIDIDLPAINYFNKYRIKSRRVMASKGDYYHQNIDLKCSIKSYPIMNLLMRDYNVFEFKN
jgi:hypothetical protein